MKLHLDTSAINFLLDNSDLRAKLLRKVIDGEFVVQHSQIQVDEVGNTSDCYGPRRQDLFEVLNELFSSAIETSVFIIGISKLDSAGLDDDESADIWVQIRNGSRKNERDAIIAVTAVKSGAILVTNDSNLETRMSQLGYECVNEKTLGKTLLDNRA